MLDNCFLYESNKQDELQYEKFAKEQNIMQCMKILRKYAKNKMPNSKVVNDKGDLLICAHGSTGQQRHNKFDIKYANDNMEYGKGFYFTLDMKEAWKEYANPDSEEAKLAGHTSEGGKRGTVKYFFIDLQNPYIIQHKLTDKVEHEDIAEKILLEIKKKRNNDAITKVIDTAINLLNRKRLGKSKLHDMLRQIYIDDEHEAKVIDDFYDLYLNQAGYDGIIDMNVDMTFSRDSDHVSDKTTDDVHIFTSDNKKIKLATPTYDDKENLIPLSERFNMNSDDIRY